MSFDRSELEEIDRQCEVSIPLEQGNVFRPSHKKMNLDMRICLNPFGTGQCLST